MSEKSGLKSEYILFRSFGKTIYEENFSIIIPTSFDKLMSVVSLVKINKKSPYTCI